MKRYLVFAFASYYPRGGTQDLILSTDSLDEAKQASPTKDQVQDGNVHVEVFDVVEGKLVFERTIEAEKVSMAGVIFGRDPHPVRFALEASLAAMPTQPE